MKIALDLPMRGWSRSRIVSPVISHHLHMLLRAGWPRGGHPAASIEVVRSGCSSAGCNLGCSSLSCSMVHRSTRISPDLRRERSRTSANLPRSSFLSAGRWSHWCFRALIARMAGVGWPPSANCSRLRPASRKAWSSWGSGQWVAPTLARTPLSVQDALVQQLSR